MTQIPFTHFSPTASGYDPRLSQFLPIRRVWSPGDVLELEFEMPIKLRRASPKVRGHMDKIALTRGRMVYCLESVDNPNVDIFSTHIVESEFFILTIRIYVL